jgi:hypothetical protein
LPDEDPTFSTVGEANLRAHVAARGENIYGEPVDYLLNYLESKYERGE